MKNITLIGMPGAGKSTVGVLLAKKIGADFTDTDLLIQKKHKKLLQQIVDELGFEAFVKDEGETIMMAPAAGFYTTPGAGIDQVRIAYVLNKEDLSRALIVLRKALEAYPGRKD